MATAQQGIMALPEMSQQAASAAISPDQMAVVDQMRQNLSPKEVSDELLANASQVDPQAVAEFTAELRELDVPPEILDLLDRLIDEVLANPENYEAIKEKYRAQGVTEDILPEEFDAELFGALNLAIEQLRGEPAGPQAFAKGGIAELKPIAKAMASYGRNGDTMLAHITPAEARMLKKRGGSGTINPVTGLPEFANIFKRIGKAIKKFAGSTVGKLVIGTALFMVAGPAAAQLLTLSSPMAVAGVSGFVAGAGTTLLAGGNLRDALKAGAIGGLTAGAMQGLTGMGPTPAGGAESAAGAAGTTGAGAGAGAGATPLSSAPLSQPLPTLPSAPAMPTLPSAVDPFAGARFAPTSAPMVSAMPPAASPFEFAGRLDLGAGTRAPTAANIMAPNVGRDIAVAAPGAAPAASVVPTVSGVQPPVDLSSVAARDAAAQVAGTPQTATQVSSAMRQGFGQGAPTDFLGKAKELYTQYLSPSGIEAQGIPAAEKAGREAITSLTQRLPDATPAMKEAAYQAAYKQAMPGMFAKYGPMTAAGLGIMGLAGGFQQREVKSPYSDLFTGGPGSAQDLLAKNPYLYYLQNLPGVTYYGGSVVPPAPPVPPPRYAHGGEVQHFQEGGNVLPSATTIGREAGLQTPLVGTAAGAPAVAPTPPVGQVGVAAAPFTQVATPATGGYNMYSPAAQNMYYGVVNQGLLGGYQYNPQTRRNEPVTSLPSVEAPYNTTAPYASLVPAEARATVMPPSPMPRRAPMQFPTGERLAEIEGSYRSLLGRDPDVAGLMAFGSPQYNLSMEDIRGMMLASPERQRYLAQQAAAQAPAPEAVVKPITVTIPPAPPRAPADPVSGLPRIAAQNVAAVEPTKPIIISSTAPAGYDYSAAALTTDRERQINDLYRSILNRDAETAGLKYWAGSGLSISEIEAQIRKIAGDIGVPLTIPQNVPVADVSRPVTISSTAPVGYDYAAAPVTNEREQQINDIYRRVLNRDAESGGLKHWRDSGLTIPEIEAQVRKIAGDIGVTVAAPRPVASSGGISTIPKTPTGGVVQRNMGGIASLAAGGYPRRTGQIDGPGTETSDSIPAMLSDGEFVMTAKAVRGAGGGDRRKGAKKMYALMHQLERNASRG
jgi:hypothetical protein